MNVLELRDLHHDFSGLHVLTGVSLEVKRGERHAIIGPNGAGKSTLFNIISGGLRPRRGAVLFKGQDITGRMPQGIVRLGVGRSFQIINVFPQLTVFQNVRSAVLSRHGRRMGVWSVVDRDATVARETREILSVVGLSACAPLPAGTLSHGDQRRLEIALTIALEPELVLLDEPTAGLNSQETRRVVPLIRQLTEGRTLVLVEHDMDAVFSLADRISVLHRGRVLMTGTPQEVRADPAVKEAYLGRKVRHAEG
jgi:branched-chain amino acid transport system ATP-binding protein